MNVTDLRSQHHFYSLLYMMSHTITGFRKSAANYRCNQLGFWLVLADDA